MARRAKRERDNGGNGAPSKGHEPITAERLIAEIHETADKLGRDGATRGDLKILSRTLRELRYAFKVFRPYRSHRKVTIFGSARIGADHPAYKQAVEFGQEMAAAGWLVVTGAASGIMEAGHVGAGRAQSMGVNILLPFEQEANRVIAGDQKLVHLKYFFTRKLLFVKESHAVALFPGGFGTLDEGFEVLTLVQTGKRDMMPLVCVDEPGGDYWTAWRAYIEKYLVARRMIDPADLSLFLITDNVDLAVKEILDFYRVYDSMRYVRGRLVLRLRGRPSEALLEEINSRFGDIVTGGRFEVSEPLPHEADEDNLSHLPRLVFRFDRRSMGRLRQLINLLNAQVEVPQEAAGAVEAEARGEASHQPHIGPTEQTGE